VTYFITDDCLDVLDRACVEECPADCIYEGRRRSYINPAACIDCGNCLAACPVEAIGRDLVMTPEAERGLRDNATFFQETLPGRAGPLGNPRGSLQVGPLGVDIARIEAAA
jgi:NAD-dependent dihydropyrimidine dehydrogenase PreA subunit